MPYRRLLVPLDGSPGAWQALRKAIALAREGESTLLALSVVENLPQYAATVGEVDEEQARADAYFTRIHTEAAQLAREQGVDLRSKVLPGHAAQNIVAYAREQAVDLIVIGHIGHSGLWGVLLGSTTDRVVDQAHCDVLVVR